ncbi:ArdC family protein [Roseovarius atlanticus]|uniref:ArdC family protein n=1 Tax=Roseovarius atlanticus TaxID=1641875 RepID=UPI001C96DFFE|nr:zincin-like metallopeptidase domain-containing protein [Roseovarius atlanticus]MBY5988201.1 DUF1738 domain-containing protein [Roseovarius atlanticus]MBY6123592.1 DUF1738 domain-containing protein [Roseovarius atlanticus]MBY6148087.1 DUF1738 domain-containing protein [Roseovarius atlanticus]
MTKIDIYQEVTDTILEAMEGGTMPWRKEWKGGATLQMPRRANGKFYQGINVLILWMTAQAKGYTADQWMTFKQAKAAGGCVRKGEKGARVVYFDTFKKEDENGEERHIPFAKAYTVFNVQQIDGLPANLQPDLFDDVDTGAQPIDTLEAFYHSTGARIVKDGTQPRYVPSVDQIHMPKVQQFETAEAYYGTLAHELVHWTGHKSRLDRLDVVNKEGYAFEELIAELGACFVTAQQGGTPDTDNSAAYLASWLKALRDDKRAIFRAASAAQKAVTFLTEASAAGRTQIAA